MKRTMTRPLAALLLMAACQVQAGTSLAAVAAVTAMLKSNPVVQAAVKQAKSFAGGGACRYEVLQSAPLPAFETGSAYEYSAEISCRGSEGAAAQVKVRGRYLAGQGEMQELQLAIAFAG